MDIGSGIAALSNGIAILKSLRSLESNYDQAMLKAKIAEVYEALAEAKHSLVDAKQALHDSSEEIERLKAVNLERAELREGDGGYKYRLDDGGNLTGFPVCPKCDPIDGRLIQLVRDVHIDAAKCPICTSSFQPVTCYTGGGNTLVSERDDRRAAIKAKQDSAMRDARSSSWLAR